MKHYSKTSVYGVLGGVLLCSSALAGPVGGVVSAGEAAISQTGSATTINQASDRAVIDWQSFNLSSGESATFHQPSAASVALNRIHDHNPSQIHGSLTANGQVMLVNPNGMVFGSTAQIDVAGLVATTADIANTDFMNGLLDFNQAGAANAMIANHGMITVKEAGMAALVAPHVANYGSIVAYSGKVTLAAGDIFTLDLYGDGLLSLGITNPSLQKQIEQFGTIAGNLIQLTAAQAASAVDSLVNMTGVIDANSAYAEGGDIIITGDQIDLSSHATLSAHGKTGGGEILVGGEYLGGGTLPWAKTVKVGKHVNINADAAESGTGGEVILWSEQATQFNGTISAKGHNGGGFVETSSKGLLGVQGNVNATSSDGQNGQWLLDPTDVTIASGAGTDVTTCSATPHTCNGIATIDSDTIETALDLGNDVVITTTSVGGDPGDIALNSNITKSGGGTSNLTFTADNDITLNGDITSTSGTLNVTMQADNSIFANNNITTQSGNITLNSNRDGVGAGAISVANATFDSASGDIILGGEANPLTTNATGTVANVIGIDLDNATLTTTTGDITLNGAGNGAGTNNYGIYLQNSAKIISTGTAGAGTIRLNGTGGNGSDFNYGTALNGAATQITTVSGNIDITGTAQGNGTNNYGIFLVNGANILSTGTVAGGGAGTIALNGTGSVNGTNFNYGTYIRQPNSRIESIDGDISITTTGSGSGTDNYGLHMENSSDILSTGTGDDAANITIVGTGGNGTNDNYGVYITDLDVSVSTVDGDIDIRGTGRGTGDNNHGVFIDHDATVTTTGTTNNGGSITIRGDAAAATNDNIGVYIEEEGTLVSSVVGPINITGNGGSDGTGTGNHGISILSGDVTSTGTSTALGATITMVGTAGVGTNSNYGIRVDDTIDGPGSITTVAGNVSLTGQGQGTGSNNYGIYLANSSNITSSGTIVGGGAGTITLDGTGGNGTTLNHGIFLDDNNTNITSAEGAIDLMGQGGSDGTGASNLGIYVERADIISNGTGANAATIRIDGTGGNGLGGSNYGVQFSNNGTLVQSDDGNITIIGRGGNLGNLNFGVSITNTDIDSNGNNTDAANITIQGTGGGAAVTNNNYGIFLNNSTIETNDGDINIEGTGGGIGGANNHGILQQGGTDVVSIDDGNITYTAIADALTTNDLAVVGGSAVTIGGGTSVGNITLNADTVNITAPTTLQTTSSGNITIAPRTASTTIGISGGAGTLAFSDADIAALFNLGAAGTLTFGALGNTGAVDIDDWNIGALGYNVAVYGGAMDLDNSPSNFDIIGSFGGTTGNLNAGTGNLTATTSFLNSLNIVGSSATLSAGYVGSTASPSQFMANLITIDGQFGPGTPTYTFAGYNIGVGTNFGGTAFPTTTGIDGAPTTPQSDTPETPTVITDIPGVDIVIPTSPVSSTIPEIASDLPSTYTFTNNDTFEVATGKERIFPTIDQSNQNTDYMETSSDNPDVKDYTLTRDEKHGKNKTFFEHKRIYSMTTELKNILEFEEKK